MPSSYAEALRRNSKVVDVVAVLGATGVIVATFMALSVFPDASKQSTVRTFYDSWSQWILLGLVAFTVFFFAQIWSLGWLTTVIRRAEGEGPYAWITFGAELMFMTVFNVEIGVWATAHLLADRISDEALYVLHVAGFVIAAPVAFAGVAYFAAILGLQRATKIFPSYLVVISALAIVGNLCAIGGLFTVSGPLNAASGVIAIGGPMVAWSLWYGALPGWFVRYQSVQRN
ncbi:hypothetical protein FZI91_15565 [Mycobacterium sp. CBMA271]|uniref:hypothetical protein n=1 Tax=unclassified Mycobacteroides TaxID=2618759 RepID=UPI0013211582|nr:MULTISPECIES: hypothetical protein [unclassified Mycobacteroides]MUM17612.1 hypothetical protein [Mycobacteroides sp. CBMA 326]MUM23114.1 hypothetical protein [Mycobacteroides sp. CBMA 271]